MRRAFPRCRCGSLEVSIRIDGAPPMRRRVLFARAQCSVVSIRIDGAPPMRLASLWLPLTRPTVSIRIDGAPPMRPPVITRFFCDPRLGSLLKSLDRAAEPSVRSTPNAAKRLHTLGSLPVRGQRTSGPSRLRGALTPMCSTRSMSRSQRKYKRRLSSAGLISFTRRWRNRSQLACESEHSKTENCTRFP